MYLNYSWYNNNIKINAWTLLFREKKFKFKKNLFKVQTNAKFPKIFFKKKNQKNTYLILNHLSMAIVSGLLNYFPAYFLRLTSFEFNTLTLDAKFLKKTFIFSDYSQHISKKLIIHSRSIVTSKIRNDSQLFSIFFFKNQPRLVLSTDKNLCKWESSVGAYVKNTKAVFKKSMRRDLFVWLSFFKLSLSALSKKTLLNNSTNLLHISGLIKNYLTVLSFFFKIGFVSLFNFIIINQKTPQHRLRTKKVKSIKKNLIKRLHKFEIESNKNLKDFRRYSLQANDIKKNISNML